MLTNKLRRLATTVAIAALAGCADARLDKLALGISPDSAAALMGDTPHRDLSYITGGNLWKIQLYARSSTGPKDSVPWRKMSPVVFLRDKTVGWGWSWWGKRAAKENIGMPSN